jgi:hypothetical protein
LFGIFKIYPRKSYFLKRHQNRAGSGHPAD